jgi:hypothetical protein
MDLDVKHGMVNEFAELQRKQRICANFEQQARDFNNNPSAMNWRALKRAMIYRQLIMDGAVSFAKAMETFSDED